jgi:glycosyltransferase involved in cell wall biosynthesis
MIALNEAHNLPAVLANLKGWAQEVFLVDSLSSDATVDIALKHGVTVVQRRFRGFGDQWNFAVNALPIQAPWTMKLDPDERLTPALKASIERAIEDDAADALAVRRRLWFMGRPLPVRHEILRLWRTGTCRFTDVLVNEHPTVEGRVTLVDGDLDHHDSPNLHLWWEKQNQYTSVEAAMAFERAPFAAEPSLSGSALERRMWLKANFRKVPFRYSFLVLHALLVQGAWRAGWRGLVWARLRADVYRMIDLKLREMRQLERVYELPTPRVGQPDLRVTQCE